MRGTPLWILLALASCAPAGKTPSARDAPAEPAPAAQAASQPTTIPTQRADLPRDPHGLTPLHVAAERGDAAAVEALLKAGADPNARSLPDAWNREGLTPLLSAIGGAYADMNRRSMRRPGEPENWSVEKARQRERQTRGQPDPVKGPMQFGRVVKLLLAHGADARASSREGFTPLHAAAAVGNAELVSLLLAAGADPNAVQRPRAGVPMTPLPIAAARGEADVVRVLLDAGADPAKVPEETRGYFVYQAMSDMEVFRTLLDRGLQLPPDALAMATRKRRADVAREILRRQKAGELDAALHAAMKASDLDELTPREEEQLVQTVTALLDAGASPSAPGGSGEALVLAILADRTRVARLLLERGAMVDWSRMKQDGELNPSKIAYSAVFENRLDRLKQLEALGMPLDVWGASVLGRPERLREVIKQHKLADPKGGADPTALYFAAAHGHAECVRILLDAGADLNERMPSWDTPNIGPRPLDSAAARGHVEVVRLLLDRGAKPELMTLEEDERAKLSPAVRDLLEGRARQP